MNMNEFLAKNGSNIQSDYSWIFPDNIPSGKHVIIGFDEKKSSTGKEIPVIILEDTDNGVKQCLSLWSADRNTLSDLDVQSVVTLALNKQTNKVTLSKA